MEILKAVVLLGGGFVFITLIVLAIKVWWNGDKPYAHETKPGIFIKKSNEWELTDIPTERSVNTLLE